MAKVSDEQRKENLLAKARAYGLDISNVGLEEDKDSKNGKIIYTFRHNNESIRINSRVCGCFVCFCVCLGVSGVGSMCCRI